jgi:hypothetical protein
MNKVEKKEAKRQDHHRDKRTDTIQKAVAVTNYLGDKDRAEAVFNGIGKGTEAVIDVVGGNYGGGVLKGLQLAGDSLKEMGRTAPIWTNEMTK